ncbi:MAG: hypothetical protein ACRD44_17770 [Bryobacteraceae bacterium]
MLGALLAATLAGLSACGGGYYSRRPVRGSVVVGARPGYVWVDNYRDWRGRRWVHVPGRWMRPPRPHAVWVPGYFDRRGHRDAWIRGRWRY